MRGCLANVQGAGASLPMWLIGHIAGAGTDGLYWPATQCGFVNYDDDVYVTSNVHVQNGLTWEEHEVGVVEPGVPAIGIP